jgi:hypothetical protein
VTPSTRILPLLIPVAALVVALLVATGGLSAYAGGKIAAKDIKRGAVTSAKIKNGTIGLADVSAGARQELTGPAGAPGSPGSPGISGYERVQVSATLASGDTFKTATAVCPEGKKLLGGGGYTQDSAMYLKYSFPQSNDRYQIQAILLPGGTITEGYQVSAVAICAYVTQ